MPVEAVTPVSPGVQDSIPVVRVDHARAAKAYRLHAALMRCLRDDPTLATDELFNVWRAEAFQRFSDAYEVAQ